MADLQGRMLIVADRGLPFERLQDCRELAQSFSNFLGEPVDLVFAQPEVMVAARIGAQPGLSDDPVEVLRPGAPAAGMPAGDFVYLPDGTPNWGAMWESFCELALYGGPAHRGEDSALRAPGTWGEAADADFDAVEEVRRGIWETTGLYAELSDQPGRWGPSDLLGLPGPSGPSGRRDRLDRQDLRDRQGLPARRRCLEPTPPAPRPAQDASARWVRSS